MIKLAAVALTIISGISIGNCLSKAEKTQLKELEAFGELIFCIYNGIASLSLPLEKIFQIYFKEHPDSPLNEKLCGFRGNYGEKIFYLSSICSDKLCSEIEIFSKTLGTLDRESQIKAAENANNLTQKEITEKRKEHFTNCRLYKTISTLISCVIAVLLY